MFKNEIEYCWWFGNRYETLKEKSNWLSLWQQFLCSVDNEDYLCNLEPKKKQKGLNQIADIH